MPAGLLLLAFGAHAPAADEVNGLRCSVCAVGDVDGDGAADFALARRGWGPDGFVVPKPEHGGPGVVWVVSGRSGEVLRTLAPELEDSTFGRALESAADFDGDGKAELLVAADGMVQAYAAASGRVVHRWEGPADSFGFGQTMSTSGDVDGDGVPDIAIFRHNGNSAESLAFVSIHSGRSGAWIKGFAPTAVGGSLVDLGQRQLQPCIALVSDRDGDGRADLAFVAARGGDEPVPALLVVSTRDGEVLYRARLEDADTDPWVIHEFADVDGDGKSDLLASFVNTRVVLLAAADGTVLREHGYVGGYMHGEGTSLCTVADLDGDEMPEYLVAANEDGFDCDSGSVVLHSGATGKELRALRFPTSVHPGCGTGVDACAIGDVDGDGLTDFVLHLPRMREVRVVSGNDFWKVLTTIDLTREPFAEDAPSPDGAAPRTR